MSIILDPPILSTKKATKLKHLFINPEKWKGNNHHYENKQKLYYLPIVNYIGSLEGFYI